MSHDLKHGAVQAQRQHENLGHKKINSVWVNQLRKLLALRQYQPETVERIMKHRVKHG